MYDGSLTRLQKAVGFISLTNAFFFVGAALCCATIVPLIYLLFGSCISKLLVWFSAAVIVIVVQVNQKSVPPQRTLSSPSRFRPFFISLIFS